jgi:hypothetical protein
VFFDRETATSMQFETNPLFSYYRNDAEDDARYSLRFYLFASRTLKGQTTRTFFYFINF